LKIVLLLFDHGSVTQPRVVSCHSSHPIDAVHLQYQQNIFKS